ncbi:helix-turn-helix domain-containing protein [Planococcus sp. FY231025]|uniref:helix-turn-helix domain-containing protein n=1 Tax=Planococcus sp. FY231025 TaxID=3455699 RepID=UPI003F8EB29B
MFTVSEICNLLDVSIETVRRWIRSGELKAQKNGKSYLVSRKDLREYLSEKHSPNSPLLKAVDEKKGTELVGAYLESIGDPNEDQEEVESPVLENQDAIQRLFTLEEEILTHELKVNELKGKILSLRKEALEIRRKLL